MDEHVYCHFSIAKGKPNTFRMLAAFFPTLLRYRVFNRGLPDCSLVGNDLYTEIC